MHLNHPRLLDFFERFEKTLFSLYTYTDELTLILNRNKSCRNSEHWKVLIKNRVPFILSYDLFDGAYIVRFNDDGFIIINELYDFNRGHVIKKYHEKIILDEKDKINIKAFLLMDKL